MEEAAPWARSDTGWSPGVTSMGWCVPCCSSSSGWSATSCSSIPRTCRTGRWRSGPATSPPTSPTRRTPTWCSTIAANHIIDPDAPSAARVVYDYYGGAERFPRISPELMRAVDQADSAQYSLEEVLAPTGWVLLNFLMDSRTGLGRFRDFRISNYQLMMQLIEACQHHGIDEILQLPDVRERVDLYHQQAAAFVAQPQRCSSVRGSDVVADLR